MRGFIKPLNLTWDIDEGTLVLGDDIEVKTDDPKKIVKWLTDAGATVHLTDVDAKTVQTFKPPDEYEGQEDKMLKVAGKNFRCHCGTNVFKQAKDSPNTYKCNGCSDIYIAETT